MPRDPVPPGSQPGTGRHPHPHTDRGPSTASPSLVALMRMTRESWERWTQGSAMRRAGYAGLKRNVAVAALREALEDDEPLVREHAAWALEQMESDSVRT